MQSTIYIKLLTTPLSHSVNKVFKFDSNLSLVAFHIANEFMLKIHKYRLIRVVYVLRNYMLILGVLLENHPRAVFDDKTEFKR